MAKKKITRKELLKKPDEFVTLSSKAANYINTHLRRLEYIGFAVVLIVVGYFAVRTYLGHINKNGQNAYNVACSTLAEKVKPGVSPETLKKSEELFAKVIDEYGLSKAARLALPQVAHLNFLDKKYDEAISLYQKFLENVSGNLRYEALANLALATCYEAKGDLKTAIKTLSTVVEIYDIPFKEAAMFNLARLYRLDNRQDEAAKILKQFVKDYQNSPFLPMAKAYL